MRKLIIGLGLLIIVGFFTIVYLTYVRPLNNQATPYEAISKQSPVILKMPGLSTLLNQLKDTPYWDEIKETEIIAKLIAQVNDLSHFLDKKTDFAELFQNSNVHITLHLTEADDFNYFYILERTSYNRFRPPDLGGYLEQQGYTFDQRSFHNTSIYEIQQQEGVLAVSYKQGLLLASFSPFLVEDAIVQLETSRSIRNDSAFTRLQEVAESNESTKMYLNCNHIGILSPLLLKPTHDHIFNQIAHFSDWIELDLLPREQGLLFNGYSCSSDSAEELDKLADLPPNEVTLPEFLPSHTSFFFYYGVSNYTDYVQNAQIDTTNAYYSYFSSWLGGEWAFGANERIGYDIDERTFCISRTTDPDVSRKSLNELARLSGGKTQIDSFYNFSIGRIQEDSILHNMLAQNYISIPNPYYTVLDDVAIFSSSSDNLKNILQRLVSNKVLGKNLQYIDFSKQLSARANFYVYTNTRRMKASLEEILSQQLHESMAQSRSSEHFSPYGLQFSNFNDLYFTSGFIHYNPDYEQETNELWTQKLDTTTHFAPVPVKNHKTNEWEFFVQDDANRIYLINNSGKIRWQRELDNPIISDVEQLDFYNNGKLQYIFNTRQKIHLVDRLGRDVANYPLKLTSPAVTGLKLVEYEQRGVYRIFVGCENGNIYGYERSGKPLPGWNPQEGVGIMNAPLYYFVIQNNDYLVAANKKGELHYFNRAGDLRTDEVVAIDTSAVVNEPFTLHEEEDGFAFIGHDTTGKVYHAYMDGSTEVVDTAHMEKAFSMKARDIDADGTVEYVYLDSSRIRVYESDFSIKFSYIFPGKVDHPIFFVPGAESSGQIPIGTLSKKENKIYLLHPNGELFQHFPLEGNTPFEVKTLRNEDEKLLVTGDGRGRLIAYRLIE